MSAQLLRPDPARPAAAAARVRGVRSSCRCPAPAPTPRPPGGANRGGCMCSCPIVGSFAQAHAHTGVQAVQSGANRHSKVCLELLLFQVVERPRQDLQHGCVCLMNVSGAARYPHCRANAPRALVCRSTTPPSHHELTVRVMCCNTADGPCGRGYVSIFAIFVCFQYTRGRSCSAQKQGVGLAAATSPRAMWRPIQAAKCRERTA